ncbi:2-oxoacid:acceptor oxidoreductase subunit alpha [Calderihabitans maritimus]|uniref:2-oxoglutarate ferredoxin oxidoreductase subunit alpha n=1 Tax=Calderihabitans maritimus TaxID=1246530 RepID=A0A1Z5HQA4_9FIRM|nr:2-oxoacid:acceptor oxidoreductase subunit alpha [Calderihabitans maritimus]GAW91460.1 2-oxoglutarate ferredoxin oxidoreductase subunit alpha [Calderihabitans maritimus]
MNSLKFWQGNEACVYGAIDAGARFYAGYPISPSTEIAELSSRILPDYGGIYVQMEDEISGIAAVIGASLSGMKAFTATSGPGFSLMQENIGFAIMAEVPCVIINVQRYGVATGVATQPAQSDVMQARWGTHGDHGAIVIAPSSVQECYDLTVEAFNAAERFCHPVIVLTDAALAHLREQVKIPGPSQLRIVERQRPSGPATDYKPYAPDEKLVPRLSSFGDDYILRVTGLVHDERGYSTANPEVARNLTQRLVEKIEKFADELPQPLVYGEEDADIVLISYGMSARAARKAQAMAEDRGIAVKTIQLRTLWPFPEAKVREVCSGAKVVMVPEMNLGQMVLEVERVVGSLAEVKRVSRTDTIVITPEEILKMIEEVAA